MRRASLIVLCVLLAACDPMAGGTTFQELKVATPEPTQAGDVPLSVTVFSSVSTTTGARVDFSTDGATTFEPATELRLEPGVVMFEASSEGRRNIFVWDTLADVGLQRLDDVRLRVTIGTPPFQVVATTGRFAVDNTGWVSIFPPEVEDGWRLRTVSFRNFAHGLAAGTVSTPPRGVLLEFSDQAFSEVDILGLTQPFEITGGRDSAFGRLVVGRNLATGQGLVLLPDAAGNFFSVPVPFFSEGLELLAADLFAQGRGWIAGATGDGFGRRGVLLLKGQAVLDTVLPAVSTSWELVSVRVLGQETGLAVGADLANGRGAALRQTGTTTWEEIEVPEVSPEWRLNAVDLSAEGEGWAVGEDIRDRQGVILRLEGGVFSLFATPEVSADWTLNDVVILADGTAWAVGEDRIARQGLILHFIDGAWERVEVPTVSRSFELRSVAFPLLDLGWAVGVDRENLRGVILRLAE